MSKKNLSQTEKVIRYLCNRLQNIASDHKDFHEDEGLESLAFEISHLEIVTSGALNGEISVWREDFAKRYC